MNTKTIIGGLFSTVESSQRAALRALSIKAGRAITRVTSGAAIEAPDSASTELIYRVDLTAGAVLIDGEAHIVTADDDVGLVGGTPDVDSYLLTGEDAALLDEPGTSQAFAVVAYRDSSGDLQYATIFGALAEDYADASEPTVDQCREAMRLAGLAWDGYNGLVIGRGVIGLKCRYTITIGAGVAENDQFEVTVGEIASSKTAGATDDDEDVAAALVVSLTSDLAALPLTVGGTGAEITLTWDAGEEPAVLTLDNGASSATMVLTIDGLIWQTIVSPSADAGLIAERAAGSLFA